MRLFLDSNIMTYIAFFEGYLCEGTRAELDLAIEHWHRTGRQHPTPGAIVPAPLIYRLIVPSRVIHNPVLGKLGIPRKRGVVLPYNAARYTAVPVVRS